MIGEITKKNFIQHEIIGLQAEIIASPDKTFENIKGQIVDETMNTFKLEYEDDGKQKIILVPKHKNRFRFTIPVDRNLDPDIELNKTIEIDGTILTKRPEDRIKKLAKLANKMYSKNSKTSAK
jgi:RNase P/RNase MRP subunit p29